MGRQTSEESLIRATIGTYFDALRESSGEKVKASFHARGTVSGIMSDSGKMAEMDTARFAAFADEKVRARISLAGRERRAPGGRVALDRRDGQRGVGQGARPLSRQALHGPPFVDQGRRALADPEQGLARRSGLTRPDPIRRRRAANAGHRRRTRRQLAPGAADRLGTGGRRRIDGLSRIAQASLPHGSSSG